MAADLVLSDQPSYRRRRWRWNNKSYKQRSLMRRSEAFDPSAPGKTCRTKGRGVRLPFRWNDERTNRRHSSSLARLSFSLSTAAGGAARHNRFFACPPNRIRNLRGKLFSPKCRLRRRTKKLKRATDDDWLRKEKWTERREIFSHSRQPAAPMCISLSLSFSLSLFFASKRWMKLLLLV